jgi:hypothetical protein
VDQTLCYINGLYEMDGMCSFMRGQMHSHPVHWKLVLCARMRWVATMSTRTQHSNELLTVMSILHLQTCQGFLQIHASPHIISHRLTELVHLYLELLDVLFLACTKCPLCFTVLFTSLMCSLL